MDGGVIPVMCISSWDFGRDYTSLLDTPQMVMSHFQGRRQHIKSRGVKFMLLLRIDIYIGMKRCEISLNWNKCGQYRIT